MSESAKPEKKTSKKKLDDAKVQEAKKKINDLLQGTGLEDPVQGDVFVPPTQDAEFVPSNDSATEWLNEQVASLSKQVEQYEKTIYALQKENTFLKEGGMSNQDVHAQNVSSSDRNKIIELYKHFESVYNGTKYGTKYATAQLSYPQAGSGVLDVMLAAFPFLHDVKQYKHWA